MNQLMLRSLAISLAVVGSLLSACSSNTNEACKTDADCPSGRYCAAGTCIYDCIMDQQCPEDFHCTTRGRCERGCVTTNEGIEACDGVDNDCDDQTDEEWPELGQYCSNQGCAEGKWVCAEDGSGVVCDGTEPAADDSLCNGLDDDCDGDTDEDAVDRLCSLQQGVCAGAMQHCLGNQGYSECDYGADYTEGLDNSCDQQDNDCDGDTDEDAQPVLQPESGDQSTDGVDNNCNGLVDEKGGVMVPHPNLENVWIDSYETVVSSNEDCAGPFYGQSADDYPQEWTPGQDGGGVTLYSCSLPGVIPSGWLSWYRAKRACEAQGKRLCASEEWSISCNHASSAMYPYGPQFIDGLCNDAWHSALTGVERVQPTGSLDGCTAAGQVFDASGNLAEWLNVWNLDFPTKAVFGGYGFRCELCNQNGDCLDCDSESMPNYYDITKVLRCKVYDGRYESCADTDEVREYFGVRCCYSQ